jgi:hypothetical protein
MEQHVGFYVNDVYLKAMSLGVTEVLFHNSTKVNFLLERDKPVFQDSFLGKEAQTRY